MNSLPILQKISLRSIATHELRLFLSMLAVVLGTSFVSGGFALDGLRGHHLRQL